MLPFLISFCDSAGANQREHAMQVVCPHCRTSLELDEDSSLTDLSCQTCGSQFGLLGDATISHDDCTEISVTSTALPKQIGHFELEELLGSGGFGAVWKAHDTNLDRTVAIKFPRKEKLTRDDAEHFFREAKAAARLHHRYIVSVHEVGRDDGFSYIVNDFVNGTPLSRYRRAHAITPEQAASLCKKIAEALHHAHECGIIHRDVKPSNIMIDQHGDPHVMDFGLAKHDASDQSTMAIDGQAFGTPSFMSPEQARGEAQTADRRSDLYSLGVVLFQLLTGELPFRGSGPVIVQQVIHDDPPHAQLLNRSVPKDLDTICWKLMEKSPAKRYETGQEVAEELGRFLAGEPIKARPISRTERALRWYGRNRFAGTLAGAFAIAIVIGVAAVTTFWLRAEQQAGIAAEAARQARVAVERETRARADAEHYLYVARMIMAQQAFELRDLSRVQSILEPYENLSEDEIDPRGFEWFYWKRKSRRWQNRFEGHVAPVLAVDVSREGRWIVSSSHDGTIRIWDATEAHRPRVIETGGQSVYAVAIAPKGHLIASAGRSGKIQVWDFSTGELREEWPAHDGTVFSLAYSADGSKLVSGGSDTLVKQWDAASGELDFEMSGHEDFVYSVDVSGRGNLIASCGLDRLVKLWDATTGKPVASLEGHHLEAWDVVFSPDGTKLASASADKTIRLWDIESQKVDETLKGHDDRVRAIDFSPDGRLLVSVGHDRSVRLWDLTSESTTLAVPYRNLNRNPAHFFERMKLPEGKLSSSHVGHAGPISCVAFGSDGSTIITAGDDLAVVSWRSQDFQERSELRQHRGSINRAVYAPDGSVLATASNDGTVCLWDPQTAGVIGEPFQHDERIYSVAISPDGRHMVTASSDGVLTIWNLEDRSSTEMRGHERGISTVVYSPDGSRIASAGHDGTVRLWDAETKTEVAKMKGHRGRVMNVVFVDNGEVLASGGNDTVVRLWDTSSFDEIGRLEGHSDTVWAMAVHGQQLATGGEDRAIRIWDVESRQEIDVLRGHGDLVQSLTFSPDGQTIASGGGDKTIRIWDVKTGESKTTLRGHDYRVWSVDFDPTGRTLVSSSYNLRFWRGEPEAAPASE